MSIVHLWTFIIEKLYDHPLKMPATRRNPTKIAGPTARGAQSRLSFGSHSKITKPSVPTHGKKKDLLEVITRTPTPECAPIIKVNEVVQEQAKAEVTNLHKTKEEEDAAKVSDAQVIEYWKSVEDERKAPRVHQQDLSIHEKILRHFDISSQYGPCIGIARMKRWKRANGLGLRPPIQVLAVLLQEEAKQNMKTEVAIVDELIS
ncbi:hypothetical protein FGG08_004215 [Glutinoglossum americanum]|uniref:DNA polymerase delta subunit 4 n=1 Tax=Glutinoglossum americanum TaxID=1670608 RepID=A0A9P8I9L7_9PEZI|nr:hypothetical protein FGG08_004215 [Glutinoglossum americanum]